MKLARSGMIAVTLGIGAFATPSALLAQGSKELYPGQKVRVTIPSAGLIMREAVFKDSHSEMITVVMVRRRYLSNGPELLQTDSLVVTAPLDSVRSLEVSLGKRNLAPQGAIIGGVVGGLILGILAKQDTDRCIARGGWFCGSPEAAFVMGVSLGAMAGGGLGALIGLAASREEWKQVPLGGVRAGLVTLSGGRTAIGLSLAF